MKKSTLVLIIVAIISVVVGIFGTLITLSTTNFNFIALNGEKYSISTHTVSDSFDEIYINTDTTDIFFVYSTDGSCRVECHEDVNLSHNVSVDNGKLSIEVKDTRNWYDHISIWSPELKITVYLPKREYTELNITASTSDIYLSRDFTFDTIDINVSTGDIALANIVANEINLSLSTGDIELTDVTCASLISKGTTGDIELTRTFASEKFNIKRNTGDVYLYDCDANEIYIVTSTGDVKGSLLTNKYFVTNTHTGDISVPPSISGGVCEINTDTGDIFIKISGQ